MANETEDKTEVITFDEFIDCITDGTGDKIKKDLQDLEKNKDKSEIAEEFVSQQSAWENLPPDQKMKVCVVCKERKEMKFFNSVECSDCANIMEDLF